MQSCDHAEMSGAVWVKNRPSKSKAERTSADEIKRELQLTLSGEP